MSEQGLLGRFLIMLLAIGVLVTGFSVTMGNYSDRFDVNVSENINRSFTYTQDIIDDINSLRTETTNKTSWIDEAKEGFLFVTLPLRIGRLILLQPLEFVKNSVSDATNYLGLPEEYGPLVGNIAIAMMIISLVLAFAAIFTRRPI